MASMASSMYCFVAGGNVHYIPVDSFSDDMEEETKTSQSLDTASAKGVNTPTMNGTKNGSKFSESNLLGVPGLLQRNKNLLYSLNDPSLSDLDSGADTENGKISDDETHSDTNNNNNNNDNDTSNNHETSSASSVTQDNTSFLLPQRSLYLPQYTVDLPSNLNNGFVQVKQLVSKVFPSISNVEDVSVKQLTGGITNMLLSCEHKSSGLTVLMRVYGQGTNLIIDRHREFVSHLMLNSLSLAPPIYARFHNGLVYGFLPGRSLERLEMQDERLYPLIASQLGVWHGRVKSEEIESGVERLRRVTIKRKRLSLASSGTNSGPSSPVIGVVTGGLGSPGSEEVPPVTIASSSMPSATPTNNTNGTHNKSKRKKKYIANVWELIEDWMNIVPIIPQLIESFQENLPTEAGPITKENIREVLQREFRWLRNELTLNSKSPTVSCHCDLLSGNIIIPEGYLENSSGTSPAINPIQFIDYEYMLPAPRAFDIANHFAEWQGFECDRSAIPDPTPSNPVMVKWVQGYLNDPHASEYQVNEVIEEIAMFYGMPGFYWGVWAVIQSEISNIDFDYADYSKLRFQEYWDWKVDYLKSHK
ncbi:hypothetical protein CAAN1_04S02102 [[Candida] anglica]|uniref:ethanolamine kinase n=1 Tax=[Candida] anglica TaxID=148631 RepID=A0ABP0E911_9ASCO